MKTPKCLASLSPTGEVHEGLCLIGNCPSVYRTETGDYLMQGFALDASERAAIPIGPGEDAVRIPRALLEHLAANLRTS